MVIRAGDAVDFLRAYKHLGVLNALKLFLPLAAGDVKIRPHGHNHAILLRPDEVDRRVFVDVFVRRMYSKDFVEQEPQLNIDAGAHAGFSACYFAHYFPHARILALEPDPANYSRLLLNARSHPNVTAIQAALWPTDGTVQVGQSDSSWNIQVQTSGPGPTVRAVSIPTLLRDAEVNTIDLLKINVEGAEREIFSGPVEWLKRVRLLMIQVHDQYWPGCAEPVYAAAVKMGFQKYQSGSIDVLRFPAPSD